MGLVSSLPGVPAWSGRYRNYIGMSGEIRAISAGAESTPRSVSRRALVHAERAVIATKAVGVVFEKQPIELREHDLPLVLPECKVTDRQASRNRPVGEEAVGLRQARSLDARHR